MCSSSYLIKIKSGSGFVINEGVSFRFFSVFPYNLYKCDLITSALDSVNDRGVSFISVLDSVNDRRASFRFFFTFFSYNSYKCNLIVSALNKRVIVNDIQ